MICQVIHIIIFVTVTILYISTYFQNIKYTDTKFYLNYRSRIQFVAFAIAIIIYVRFLGRGSFLNLNKNHQLLLIIYPLILRVLHSACHSKSTKLLYTVNQKNDCQHDDFFFVGLNIIWKLILWPFKSLDNPVNDVVWAVLLHWHLLPATINRQSSDRLWAEGTSLW